LSLRGGFFAEEPAVRFRRPLSCAEKLPLISNKHQRELELLLCLKCNAHAPIVIVELYDK
jgi:hypothetical protein